jgi:molecular chaperone GrpE (heat shock protein)
VEVFFMSQSLWESEAAENAQPEEHTVEAVGESAGESTAELAASSAAQALSVDEFSALEERILRTVDLVKRERLTRSAAEERANAAEAQLREQMPLAENLQKAVSALHAEREQVRQRVERLLSQLDALEL